MSDTTTQLNQGSGGDSMNESQITQSDGVTTAKSPRVALVFDDGRIVRMGTELPVSLCGEDRELLSDIRDLLMRLVQQGGGVP